ncbi:MAG: hypothetical protein EB130_08165 [Actinobacteria bacterium]|nr:hypothetical protein [Actinomycetota bacterium]
MSAITVGIVASPTRNTEPNGPNSTAMPCDSTAATALVTCGPGLPSTNGSTVNSTTNMAFPPRTA